MAVCMEHIIRDTLIDLLMFDFLTAIRKLRHILYCNVRVLLCFVIFFWRMEYCVVNWAFNSYKEKAKQQRFLQSRGFGFDEIKCSFEP
jgi:hypothetical protein